MTDCEEASSKASAFSAHNLVTLLLASTGRNADGHSHAVKRRNLEKSQAQDTRREPESTQRPQGPEEGLGVALFWFGFCP